MKTLSEIKEWAIQQHASTNHTYGEENHPYSYHLDNVVWAAISFNESIPDCFKDAVYAACYCHDLIEDARVNYNDIIKATDSVILADIVYALTNEKGKNRAERASDKYYEGIRNTPFASFVKLCDRVANVTYSKSQGTNSRMFNNYVKEMDHFIQNVKDDASNCDLSKIIQYLQSLVNVE